MNVLKTTTRPLPKWVGIHAIFYMLIILALVGKIGYNVGSHFGIWG